MTSALTSSGQCAAEAASGLSPARTAVHPTGFTTLQRTATGWLPAQPQTAHRGATAHTRCAGAPGDALYDSDRCTQSAPQDKPAPEQDGSLSATHGRCDVGGLYAAVHIQALVGRLQCGLALSLAGAALNWLSWRSGSAGSALSRWAGVHPTLAEAGSLQELLRQISRAEPPRRDPMLLALFALAQDGDRLARPGDPRDPPVALARGLPIGRAAANR